MINKIVEEEQMVFFLESVKKYKKLNNTILLFQGWLVNNTNEKIKLEFYQDNEQIPFEDEQWYERSDVKDCYCNDENEKEALGFTIEINASALKAQYKCIEIYTDENHGSIVLSSIEKDEIDKIDFENKIVNKIDWVTESDELLRIVGWGYGTTGDIKYGVLEFEVFDSEQNKVEYSIHRVYREDVNELIPSNCNINEAFGYEIGLKKQKSGTYKIKCTYAGMQTEEMVFTDAKTNRINKYLDENIWTLPYFRVINENLYLYNVDNISIFAQKKLFINGWVNKWNEKRNSLCVMSGDDKLKSNISFKENKKLERYDFKIETDFQEIRDNMSIVMAIDGEEFEVKKIEASNLSKYEYKSQVIGTYTDVLKMDKSRIQLIGWGYVDYFIGEYKPVEVRVKDSKGEYVEHTQQRFRRSDVSEVMKDDKNNPKEWAYVLEWVCENDKDYIVEYSGNGLTKTEVIDVENLKREERERAYSYPSKAIMRKCISWQRVKDDFYYIRNRGWKEFKRIYNERVGKKEIVYQEWLKWNSPSRAELRKQRKATFERMPKISIVVPTYRTPEKFLREMLDSVVNQTYSNWELCLGDGSMDDSVIPILEEYHNRDSRIVYKRLDDNYGISGNTNGALELATGDFIALLDHDDLLTPDALYEVVKAINVDKDVDVVYTDEDKVSLDLKTYFEPHFKPDFNIDLLRSCNYICHFFVVDKRIVDKVGGFRSECDGSQDYDFILRCTSAAKRIEHVARCVYNWRCHPASTAMNPESKLYCYEAGKRALELHLEAMNVKDATVERAKNYGYYIVSYPVKEECLVSIIWIDKSDRADVVETNIRTKSSYKNLEFIRAHKSDNETNNSKLLNEAVKSANGKYIIFVHDSMEVVTENWIEIMLSNCMRDEVGIVVPKIYNSDNEIVQAGYVVGLRGLASRVFIGKQYNEHGYEGRLLAQCDLTAAPNDCMMISKQLFEEVGGFDEKLAGSCEDIDLCLKVRKRNLLVMFTSYAAMKCDIEPEKSEAADVQYMKNKWADMLARGDYSYNKNFDLQRGDFEL